eukprot:1617956-Pleurochrysis_carterae.AAC.1
MCARELMCMRALASCLYALVCARARVLVRPGGMRFNTAPTSARARFCIRTWSACGTRGNATPAPTQGSCTGNG